MNNNSRKFTWLFFIGIGSLFPIIIKVIIYGSMSMDFDWAEFFKWGELFAITSVICVGCLGEILLNEKAELNKKGQVVTILLLMFISIFSMVFYSIDTLLLTKNNEISKSLHLNVRFLTCVQMTLYCTAVVAGTFSRNFSI